VLIPNLTWEGVTTDFVADLPESTASAYTDILVVVDRLTKMAIYLPCRKDSDADSPELVRMFSKNLSARAACLATPSSIEAFSSRAGSGIYLFI
jgi:hypothetical protein